MPLTTTLFDCVPDQLRGLRFLALSDTGYLVRGTVTDNAGGGGTYTFGTAGTFACRVDTLGGGESVIADRLDERTTHRITLPPESVVEAADRFVVNGETYEITAVRTRTQEQVRVCEAVEAS